MITVHRFGALLGLPLMIAASACTMNHESVPDDQPAEMTDKRAMAANLGVSVPEFVSISPQGGRDKLYPGSIADVTVELKGQGVVGQVFDIEYGIVGPKGGLVPNDGDVIDRFPRTYRLIQADIDAEKFAFTFSVQPNLIDDYHITVSVWANKNTSVDESDAEKVWDPSP